jgi:hypothetical protein
MRLVRRLVYSMGFRPSHRSFFYAYMLDFEHTVRDARKHEFMIIHMYEENKNG